MTKYRDAVDAALVSMHSEADRKEFERSKHEDPFELVEVHKNGYVHKTYYKTEEEAQKELEKFLKYEWAECATINYR